VSATTQGAPRWALTPGTWEQAEALVGQELETIVGADEVTRADIRRKLEVFGFDSPLNTDDEVARAHGYREVPAPTSMLLTWCMPAYWKPGDPPLSPDDPLLFPPYAVVRVPAPGGKAFATNFETEFHEPVYAGDRITSTTVLVDITRKTTAVGEGAFFTVETTHRKQTAEVAGIDRLTIFRYDSEGEGA